MGRHKKEEIEEEQKSTIARYIFAVVFLLLGICGMISIFSSDSGLFGTIARNVGVFLFGNMYFVLFVFIIGISSYLLLEKDDINFFSSRFVGVYTLLLIILVFTHFISVEDNSMLRGDFSTFLSNTFNTIKLAFSNEGIVKLTGGGMIGGLFAWSFVKLFSITGSYIAMAILLIFSIIMIFEISLADACKGVINFFKKLFTSSEEEEDEEVDEEDENEENERASIQKEKQEEDSDGVSSIKFNEETPKAYKFPPVDLLDPIKVQSKKAMLANTEVIGKNTKDVERVFEDFNMHAKVINVRVGPSVTQYVMEVDRGTKLNKVLGISREMALALAAKEVRIEAPIPGTTNIGVEIPNVSISPVSMREIMESKEVASKTGSKLLAPLGKDIMGNVKFVEINKTPHMLVAGATGSGKSVCINNIIISVLMKATPEEVKMVLVDPKKVEFNVYEGIPHLLTPVVTDPKKANAALQKICVMMDDRYETFKNSNTKNITGYNEWVEKELKRKPDCGLKPMPYILVIIDELADLMLVAAKEVEESIMRITQLARAAGIHLIVATQRPSADVITGVVKANIPTRVSFAVSSSIDSRTILDMTGAEKLLGKGDMLYKPMDDNIPTRIQGSFVSDEEISRVVEFVKKGNSAPIYNEKFNNLESNSAGGSSSSNNKDKDVLYDEILSYAKKMGQISASLIQRKYSIGYNRAARIMDMFEEEGLVGPAKGSKPRDVLVKDNTPEEDE